MTRLLAAVKTEEVGTESFYNLFRLALLGTFPKGEGFGDFVPTRTTNGRPYFDSAKITVIFVGVDVRGDPFCANLN